LKRQATITRKTKETEISATVDLDGTGAYDIKTGIGFLDHMLEQLARHALIDITLRAKGDLHIDFHHTAEDTGIVLGQAVAKALPKARVLKGFNQFGAEFHLDPAIAGTKADVYLAGDDAQAKADVSEIAASAGFEPVDAGPLRNASVLENLAMLWIHLSSVGGKGRTVAFKLLSRG